MDKIKSAYEMAMERFQQRKEVPRPEIDRLEYLPVGRAIAANYLKEINYDIFAEIGKHSDNYKKYIIEGMQETFLNNILPPADKSSREKNKKAMEGLLLIKEDKRAVGEVFGRLEHLFKYYEQALAQAYSRFKDDYGAKIKAAVGKMTGGKVNIDPEKQPGFREEWMKALSRLNDQYISVLGEQKDLLRKFN
ncbi:hypothetical protein L9W92_02990 [Pelotomaculum terephthalicicum JT]|uniref:hypothetical protein n=1 Tax=Pelotomaculum TaxID=191373 RepID=UPI0009CEB76C|nr:MULTISPECIES: hypothetical protein [Pelotomaculum]MCG9967023.1 hypothetical protein [Pelotomaculum terephthalicicum JT]OPX90531.1 MAG: hypothetical protein A4E54_00671 [Pelotomaculum sp. PtaB.Bin117]OPY60067.1 MAG: hypothetical protein A4E56_02929 [Pelotomaculum sp. PtaU1.Bin065]